MFDVLKSRPSHTYKFQICICIGFMFFVGLQHKNRVSKQNATQSLIGNILKSTEDIHSQRNFVGNVVVLSPNIWQISTKI